MRYKHGQTIVLRATAQMFVKLIFSNLATTTPTLPPALQAWLNIGNINIKVHLLIP